MTLPYSDNLSVFLTCLLSAVQRLEHMIGENITRVMDFILLGFSVRERWKPFFLLILVSIFSNSLVGNIGMIS